MNLDEKEFGNLCEELLKQGSLSGVDPETMTTIIAKAIRNREEAISNNQQPRSVDVGIQPIYGPPPRQEEVVVDAGIQPIYGPPPRNEINVSRKR